LNFFKISDGYTGSFCELVLKIGLTPRPCSSTTCLNGGLCIVQNVTQAVCVCRPGWAGLYCEQDIPECNSNPCQNGASCIELTPHNIKCACLAGKRLN
jgi:protein crumbs